MKVTSSLSIWISANFVAAHASLLLAALLLSMINSSSTVSLSLLTTNTDPQSHTPLNRILSSMLSSPKRRRVLSEMTHRRTIRTFSRETESTMVTSASTATTTWLSASSSSSSSSSSSRRRNYHSRHRKQHHQPPYQRSTGSTQILFVQGLVMILTTTATAVIAEGLALSMQCSHDNTKRIIKPYSNIDRKDDIGRCSIDRTTTLMKPPLLFSTSVSATTHIIRNISYRSTRLHATNRMSPEAEANGKDETCTRTPGAEKKNNNYNVNGLASCHHPNDPNGDDFCTNGNSISNNDDNTTNDNNQQQDGHDLVVSVDKILKWTPIAIPILAYLTYDPLAVVFSSTIEALSVGRNFVAVDGGAYQAKIITPAINGIVVQAIAILFAVLSGNTISTLRQRQQDICFAILQETTQIRILATTMMLCHDINDDDDNGDETDYLNDDDDDGRLEHETHLLKYQEKCRRDLIKYIDRLLAEGHSFSRSYETYSMDVPELQSIMKTLTRMEKRAMTLSGSSPAPASSPHHYLPVCYNADLARDSIRSLWQYRSERLTSLMSTFPTLHYVIISTLAISMCGAFLMETDQDILVFLNAIQLRLLWTSLVGTFCALGVVLYDLNHPFRGSYQVSVHAVDELIPIRDNLMRYTSQQQERVESTTIKG